MAVAESGLDAEPGLEAEPGLTTRANLAVSCLTGAWAEPGRAEKAEPGRAERAEPGRKSGLEGVTGRSEGKRPCRLIGLTTVGAATRVAAVGVCVGLVLLVFLGLTGPPFVDGSSCGLLSVIFLGGVAARVGLLLVGCLLVVAF